MMIPKKGGGLVIVCWTGGETNQGEQKKSSDAIAADKRPNGPRESRANMEEKGKQTRYVKRRK